MFLSDTAIHTVIFLFGLCIGSFLNVCIYRIPARKSIVFPPSQCPKCGASIRFYDNIPVIGWLLLQGRCRDCGDRISWRYPVVELLTGGFCLAIAIRFGLVLPAIVYFVFTATLIVVTFIDIDHRIIPDRITLPGIPLAFAATFLLPEMTWQASLIGLLAGGGSLLLVAVVYSVLTGKEGMGGGDIKLLAMIGTLCGWPGVLFTVFFASLLGSVIGIIAMRGSGRQMKQAIPFGPFLSAGAIGYLFYGPEVIRWYLSGMGG